MAAMPNYWVHATGRYYFPGMYTALLPMIPGVSGIWRVLAATGKKREAVRVARCAASA
ncbi:MAG: hypothetical protein WKG00_10395 [Polyangiaceae bacterium]